MRIEPVGLKEIAERLGVRQQTASMWRHRGVLPEPEWTVSGMPAWDWATIQEWSENRSGKGVRKVVTPQE